MNIQKAAEDFSDTQHHGSLQDKVWCERDFQAGANFVIDQATVGYDKWYEDYGSKCRLFDSMAEMVEHGRKAAYAAGTLSTEKTIQSEDKELAAILTEIFKAIKTVKNYSQANIDIAEDYGELVSPCFEKLRSFMKSLNIETPL